MPRAWAGVKEFHFDVARLKGGIRLRLAGERQAEALGRLSFAEGALLFRAVAARLAGKRGMVDPEQVEWPPLPDPLGILQGRQTLPWKLLNPAVKRCIVCTPKGDGGVDCVEVPCEGPPVS